MKDAYRRLMEAPRIKKSTGVLSPHYCKLVNVIFIAAILKPITMVIWYNDAYAHILCSAAKLSRSAEYSNH